MEARAGSGARSRPAAPPGASATGPSTSTSSAAGPALYFVDGLARAIESDFCEVFKELVKKALDKALTTGDRKRPSRKEAVAREFDRALENVHSSPAGWAPSEVPSFGEQRGGMVVFWKPYPTYRHLPQAAFRGFMRVDGDDLLRRISGTYAGARAGDLALPYPKTPPAGPRGKKSKQQLVDDLAEELQASRAFTEQIWESFLGTIAGELERGRPVTLRNLGRFEVTESQGRKQVKFRPSETLKDRVRSPGDAPGKTP